MPDIVIDFINRLDALDVLPHVKAVRKTDDGFAPHNTGVYFHNIPHNPFTGMATVDYKEAENRGYFKMDFLNVSAYNGVTSEQHLLELCNKEPDWDLLLDLDVVGKLFQVSNHFETLVKLKPRSIEQLAAVLAIIRPGKKHLINKSWDEIMEEVWLKSDDGYTFKKSHSFSYAMLIIVQLNLNF